MPEDNITLWQWCTFSFVEPMLQLASLRRLEYADVWALSPFYQHKILFEKYLCCLDRYNGLPIIQNLLEIYLRLETRVNHCYDSSYHQVRWKLSLTSYQNSGQL